MAETVYSTPTYSRVSLPTVGSREISSDRVGDHGEVLTLDGRCDLSTALQADQWIVSALDAGTSELIVDLRGVTSLEPVMLHMLFRGALAESTFRPISAGWNGSHH